MANEQTLGTKRAVQYVNSTLVGCTQLTFVLMNLQWAQVIHSFEEMRQVPTARHSCISVLYNLTVVRRFLLLNLTTLPRKATQSASSRRISAPAATQDLYYRTFTHRLCKPSPA